jgi:hypothetical protein
MLQVKFGEWPVSFKNRISGQDLLKLLGVVSVVCVDYVVTSCILRSSGHVELRIWRYGAQ